VWLTSELSLSAHFSPLSAPFPLLVPLTLRSRSAHAPLTCSASGIITTRGAAPVNSNNDSSDRIMNIVIVGVAEEVWHAKVAAALQHIAGRPVDVPHWQVKVKVKS